MKAWTQHKGLVAPLVKSNIDTDIIIPKQFLKSIKRTGYGDFIFDEWRYLDKGEPGMDCTLRMRNMDFVLNQKRYQGASILLAGPNFGCGSSREHAPWGLAEFGFRAIIASSFADIFFNNCTKNGIVPVVLSDEIVQKIENETLSNEGYTLKIDLIHKTVSTPSGAEWSFELDSRLQERLIEGLDDIALTLQKIEAIKSFEQTHKEKAPWLFNRFEG